MTELESRVLEAAKRIGNLTPPYRKSDPVGTYSVMVEPIVEDCSLDKEGLKISRLAAVNQVMGALSKAYESEETFQAFKNEIERSKRRLGERPDLNTTVGFPLGFRFEYEGPEKFEVLGKEITRISYREWEKRYIQKAKADESYESITDDLEDDFESGNFSFWEMEYECFDWGYAVEKTFNIIDVLLSEINYSYHSERIYSHGPPQGSRRSNLTNPFLYIVVQEREYRSSYSDVKHQTPSFFEIPWEKDAVSDVFTDLPKFNGKIGGIEKTIMSALRSYQLGLTESSQDQEFLHYWRGIEQLALTGETDTSFEILKRTQFASRIVADPFPKTVVKEIKKKRNALVHEGVDVHATREENNILKILLERFVWFYVSIKEELDYDELRLLFENASTDIEVINHKKESLKAELHVLEKLVELSESDTI